MDVDVGMRRWGMRSGGIGDWWGIRDHRRSVGVSGVSEGWMERGVGGRGTERVV